MKKIRINLYGPEFRPKKVILSLEHMLIIWLVCIVVVSVCYGITDRQRKQLQRQVDNALIKNDELNTQLMQIKTKVGEFSPDGALEERLTNLRKLVTTKKDLKDFLLAHKDLKNTGYGIFMEDLSKISNPRVSVEEFHLHGKQASISGLAYKGYDIPSWIAEFKNYEALSAIVFGGVKANLDEENNLVKFTLPFKSQELDTKKEGTGRKK